MSQVITTILLDDNPKGLRLIEMANWSGKAFVVPRGKLKELRSREDAQQPGLYFLFGEGDERSTVYIGQSENVVDRLLSHDSNRKEDEWNTAFVFVGDLDSTFIKFLESISVNLAKKVNRYEIFNSTSPKKNRLSEAQKITANDYFERVNLIISLFGYLLFEEPKVQKENTELYIFKTDGAIANGKLLESQEFIVYKGSTSRIRETASFKGSGLSLRKRLIEEKILVGKDEYSYIFNQDYIFSSPSSAADVVSGRSTNGWTAWKDENSKTLDENVRK
jgi:hypothetical protein